MRIKELLQLVIDSDASDLHLIAGTRPSLRIDGELNQLANMPILTPEVIEAFLKEILNSEQVERLKVNKEIDFSLSFSEKGRFRVNAYTQRGTYAVAFRIIPLIIPSIDSLSLPKILHSFKYSMKQISSIHISKHLVSKAAFDTSICC